MAKTVHGWDGRFESPTVVAIIQARMGSERLPGKVLERIRGIPALELQVRRLLSSVEVTTFCIATSVEVADDAIEGLAHELGILCVRGSESDVLSRFADALRLSDADVVVRLTADCPFHDHRVVDQAIAAFRGHRADYVSNAIRRTFPIGLDCEVMSAEVLLAAASRATSQSDREHVTPYIYRELTDVRSVDFGLPVDLSGLRWTLDTAADLQALRAIAERLPGDEWHECSWTEILGVVLEDPSLAEINRHVEHRHVT